MVSTAAELREPHRVARYLEDTAAAYHKFYDSAGCCRAATRRSSRRDPGAALAQRRDPVVIDNGLDLLGVSAPERM